MISYSLAQLTHIDGRGQERRLPIEYLAEPLCGIGGRLKRITQTLDFFDRLVELLRIGLEPYLNRWHRLSACNGHVVIENCPLDTDPRKRIAFMLRLTSRTNRVRSCAAAFVM